MKTLHSIIASGILLASVSGVHATVVGFGQLGGSNTTVPADLASFAIADGNGYTVSNGATPDIGLTWDPNWDIHLSTHFTSLENQEIGGGAWDTEDGGPHIGQLDIGNHTIQFDSNPGFALVLNSFDFGLTDESAGSATWDFTLTDLSNNGVVWEQTLTFNNDTAGTVTGDVRVISPNFTGEDGKSYLLTFNRTAQSYNSDGRNGIDNLSFNEVAAVPEPATIGLLGVAGLGLAAIARRKKIAA